MVGGSSLSTSSSCSSLHSVLAQPGVDRSKTLNPFNSIHHRLPLRRLSLSSSSQSPTPPRCTSICCSNSPPGFPGPGESDSRTVLDAFFLGKALGEALTERLESAVGEFLSTVGRLQAEQQRQIQDFQEDVLERAKRAKEQAAREALEEQGRLIPNSKATTTATETVTNGATWSSSAVPPRGTSSTVDEDRTDQDSLSSIPVDE